MAVTITLVERLTRWAENAWHWGASRIRRKRVQDVEDSINSGDNDALNKRVQDFRKRAKNKSDSN